MSLQPGADGHHEHGRTPALRQPSRRRLAPANPLLPTLTGTFLLVLQSWCVCSHAEQVPSAAGLHPLKGKKLIAFGWDSPNTLYLKEHLEVFEQSGYQGVVINVCHDPRLPNRTDARRGEEPFRLADKVFVPQRLRLEDWAYVVEDLRECRFQNLTDNFLLMHAIPAQVDFFDHNFEDAIHNARVMATLAREGGVKGLLMDVENYSGHSLFCYPERPRAGEKSFPEYQAAAREAGRRWAQAACEAYPEVVFFFLFCHSAGAIYVSDDKPLEQTSYGLLPAFADGMLEGKTSEARIVDGFEWSYPYKGKPQFLHAYHMIRHTARKLSAVPRLYDAGVEAGFGIWLDHRSKDWSAEDVSENFHSPESLRAAVRAGLEVSDRYVWVWAERAKRWYGSSYPEAYQEATRAATSPPAAALSTQALPRDSRLLTKLPLQWHFRRDPEDAGVSAGFHRPDLDDSQWRELRTDQAWEKQGIDYDGFAWYRVRFDVDGVPPGSKAYLLFGAVDESAWVYLNGHLVGEHDLGEAGWDRPFAVEVTSWLQKGANCVAVRVLDRVLAGGIWKPVELVASP